MGKKIRRIAAGAALAGLLTAILLPGAALVRAANLRAQTAARLSGQDDPASPLPLGESDEEAADKFTAAVCGPAGSRCTVTDADGSALGVFRLDADGWGSTPRLTPGTYGLRWEDTMAGSFTLLENAAISVSDGDTLWTDGEILYLSGEQRGTICVTVRLSAAAFASALSGGLDAAFVLTLESAGGETQQQALGFYKGMEAAPTDGFYSLCAEFSGLPADGYTLSVSTSVDISPLRVTVDGAPAGLPAEVTLGGNAWQATIVLELTPETA